MLYDMLYSIQYSGLKQVSFKFEIMKNKSRVLFVYPNEIQMSTIPPAIALLSQFFIWSTLFLLIAVMIFKYTKTGWVAEIKSKLYAK